MNIVIYTKAGCGICESVKKKLALFDLPYETKDIEFFTAYHEGWRDDGSAETLARYARMDKHLPLIKIDDKWYDYPGAMKFLKSL